jgi:GAF domain-containing protein
MDPSSIADINAAARIAAANAHSHQSLETEPRFPGEDGGQSLVDMARRDLDAALQLLAERAQYITGASGAAIALRRGEHADMLCRASAGSNAPELGALLSMEYGLSGESVRTRQALRCDDTETDPRVNREGCRQLGIASVVVMPIVSEQQVLGVFELFSGKPRAFEERDLSALQRLGEMVETAVKHAEAAQRIPAVLESGVEAPLSDAVMGEALSVESARVAIGTDLAAVAGERETPPTELEKPLLQKTDLEQSALEKAEPELVPKKPLFWSAAQQIQPNVGQAAAAADSVPVPAELRNLQKCKACGFPVSQGRTLCVECEEKQWRGQRVP